MEAKRHAPATLRNREPITSVLRDVLPSNGVALEIASGSGEHIAYFASQFPSLTWQPSETNSRLFPSIDAWARDVADQVNRDTIRPPVYLNTCDHPWPLKQADAILAINMIHISPWESCQGLMTGSGSVLGKEGVLFLYGPFLQSDVGTAPSNLAFDDSLRQQNPQWGIRDLNSVVALADENDLDLVKTVPMPSNNLSVVFRKRRG